jgi:hypothetical protein
MQPKETTPNRSLPFTPVRIPEERYRRCREGWMTPARMSRSRSWRSVRFRIASPHAWSGQERADKTGLDSTLECGTGSPSGRG